jgi:lysophospholipase L1-like esterase
MKYHVIWRLKYVLMGLVMLAMPVLSAGQVHAQRGQYAALGDSVAAGLGLPTSAGGDPVCGVSGAAYPALVAKALNENYHNYSCSGATAGDLFTEQHLSGTSRDIEPQLSRAFAGRTPSFITITAGANDTYWQYFIRKCYVATCGTSFDRVAAATLVSVLRVKMEFAMADINFHSNGRPPLVLLTGYYKPFSAACANGQTNITASEFGWLNQQTEAINRVLADTASAHSSHVRFVPVSFSGHELCSAKPWVQGIDSAAPFHPTARGQHAIANAVLRQIR